MELRSRIRLNLRRAAMTAALGALLAPATAGAASKAPLITKVSPTSVNVGDTLIITGKNFRRGKAKNTVLFKRDGGKALFVKADVSTTKRLTVVIPKQLEKFMAAKSGLPQATRFRLRILTTKLSKAFTTGKKSPVVGPAKAAAGPGGGPGGGNGTTTLDPNADCDSDGLTNGLEATIGTNPCNADSDGDGVTDGFEYRSAIDLNQDNYRQPTQSVPYPGKRPYPNPLDGTDANVDYDGDGLTLADEFGLWHYTVVTEHASPSLDHMLYSDGLKASVPGLLAATYDKQADFENWLASSDYATVTWPDAVTASIFDVNRSGGAPDPAVSDGHGALPNSETSYLDSHGRGIVSAPDGYLSDDERDEDADGLSNWVETHGPMLPTWYGSRYPKETPYPIKYAGTSPTDADSDGDGVRDGADDQDHDDIPNFDELSRRMAVSPSRGYDAPDALSPSNTPAAGRVNPYNPCLPFTDSRTCPTFIPFTGAWAPFDGPPWNATGSDVDYLVLN
jgi:hypothetical protein